MILLVCEELAFFYLFNVKVGEALLDYFILNEITGGMELKFKNTAMLAALSVAAMTPAMVITEQAEASTVFSDIKSSDYFAEAVESLASRQIVSGYQGKFSPYRNVTRGEAVKMLYGIINPNGFPEVNAPRFVDVNTSHMFYKEIAYLSELKIINGTGGTQPKFNPNANVTREEMAVMISQAFDLEDPELDESGFEDIREPYAQAIRQLYAYGITEGLTYTKFGSKDYVTRGQIAVFLHRAEQREMEYTEDIYGEIQSITRTYIQIEGKKYAIPERYKHLFSVENEKALKGSLIGVEVNGQQIYDIATLRIASKSTKATPVTLTGHEDEDWQDIEVTINTPYIRLQNVVLDYVAIDEDTLQVELNGTASRLYVLGFDREQFTLTGTGAIQDMSQESADSVAVHFNGTIKYYSFGSGNEVLDIGNETEIHMLLTDYSKDVIEERVNSLSNVAYIAVLALNDENKYADYYKVDDEGNWLSANGEVEVEWESDEELIEDDEWTEEAEEFPNDQWGDTDEEFVVDDSIVNPDFQGPFSGTIYAIEDGQMKVGKHWLTMEGNFNTFFNDNKEMLIGSSVEMRVANNKILSLTGLIIRKSGTIAFDYWNSYGLTINYLDIHADDVEVKNINVTYAIYLREEVQSKFTYKDGKSTGSFVIEGEEEANSSAVQAADLVLSFENAQIDDLTILQPNRKIEMGRSVYLNNFTVDVPKNTAKRYPVISMDSVYEQVNFTTRFANINSVSSFIESELSPEPPVISGNAVIEELNVLKGTVDWQAKGLIHSLTSAKDNAVTIGPYVLIGATYDRFGDAVSGQFLVKNGADHKTQLNVPLDDTAYFIPKMESKYLMYGEHHVFVMKPENLKVAYKFGTAEELESFQIGQQISLASFASEKEYNSHMYWHDQELLVFALDENNRILSKQLYTPLEEREEAFRFRRNGEDAYIESIATSSITSTDYVYYFVEGEMRSVNDPNEVKWLNDPEAVNRIQLPLGTTHARDVSETVGFIITVNGEQQIHQLHNSRENNLRTLPGLGRDLLENKSEGAKVMTKHILKGMYEGSQYVPKGFEYDFVLKQYMADFSEESNLTMTRIGEIVVKHDKSETTLQYIRHIQGVRSQMNTIEARVQQMLNEGRQSEARETIEALREQVELVREEALRNDYSIILDRLELNI